MGLLNKSLAHPQRPVGGGRGARGRGRRRGAERQRGGAVHRDDRRVAAVERAGPGAGTII